MSKLDDEDNKNSQDASAPKPKRKPGRPARLRIEDQASELDLFYRWRDDLLPRLVELQKRGSSPEDILQAFSAEASARLVQIALSSPDQKLAMQALQDMLDRTEGKAVQRKEVTTKFDKLSDDELDALLATQMGNTGTPAKPKVVK